jgi:hypothetical protein
MTKFGSFRTRRNVKLPDGELNDEEELIEHTHEFYIYLYYRWLNYHRERKRTKEILDDVTSFITIAQYNVTQFPKTIIDYALRPVSHNFMKSELETVFIKKSVCLANVNIDKEYILTLMLTTTLMSKLNKANAELIIDKMKQCSIPKGNIIYNILFKSWLYLWKHDKLPKIFRLLPYILKAKKLTYRNIYYICIALLAMHERKETQEVKKVIQQLDIHESNIFCNQVKSLIIGNNTYSIPFKDSNSATIAYGDPWGRTEYKSDIVMPIELRCGHNVWIEDPYQLAIQRIGQKPSANLSFLLAYWLY